MAIDPALAKKLDDTITRETIKGFLSGTAPEEVAKKLAPQLIELAIAHHNARATPTKEPEEPLAEQKREDAPLLTRENVTVDYGDKIILPKGMTFKEGREWLRRMEEEENTEVAISEKFQCFPLEGLVALAKVLDREYGFTQAVVNFKETMFGKVKEPPTMVNVEVDHGKFVQVPWSKIEIPRLYGWLRPGVAAVDGRVVFVLNGQTIKKHEKEFIRIIAAMREVIAGESIYRGKAIRVTFPNIMAKDFDPVGHAPKFMDLTKVDIDKLVFSEDVQDDLNASVYAPIRFPAGARQIRAPFKRGVLLYGPYGCGKTMLASLCAYYAVQQGITFMHLEDVSDLPRAIEFARTYEPCVIFAEDVDRLVSGTERTAEIDAVANTVDGINSKNRDLFLILTTNHLERIHEVMMRPGRFDAIVHITPPNAAAIQRLIRVYGGELIDPAATLVEVGTMLSGSIPARVREVIERAKLSELFLRSGITDGFVLSDRALVNAARGVLKEHALYETLRNKPIEETAAEAFARTLTEKAASQTVEALREEGVIQ